MLAASEEQGRPAFDALRGFAEAPAAPEALRAAEWSRREVNLDGGAALHLHTGSSRSSGELIHSVCGSTRRTSSGSPPTTPERIEVLDDALGLPIGAGDIGPQVVIASTRHRANGAVRCWNGDWPMARSRGRVYEWCYKESLRREHDGVSSGWLRSADLEAMRGRMTATSSGWRWSCSCRRSRAV